ncbi:dUTP diphosphatase [Micromonospora sp. C31]|uniref:dUTP diphosphatase n=1 Tax=Micromonospora sp. C31 TaxID=2824876 RepID=UPI0027DDAFC8|nr:dUTP diphosphatase [Micromonospora sp. C31]
MTDVVPVPVRQLDPELPLPAYAHPGDAGADLVAAADVELPPGGRALVPTGVAIALPEGYVGLVHPRSGLAARLGVTVLNAPGTVDAGYRGEILVNLINHDRETSAKISRGDRIAQLVVQRVARAEFRPATELPASRRGSGGHGSTGGHAGLASSPTGGGPGTTNPEPPDARRTPDVPDARREERDRAGGRTEEVAG